ncbi:hypothetical protein TNCV_4253711 [Trichonephila clavipes]|nr:hypothetical protein TNCV_4253711 [Trichonephila clavipes]
MVEVKPINISLNQQSPSLSVGTAISPTLTEEFIIHPSVYSEIEKLGHAKSDVLLSESGSSLSVDYVLCKKANGAMKTSSVEFISAHLTLYLLNFIGLCCSKDLPALAVETKEKRNRLNRRPELYRGKYRCVRPKINLLKKMFLCRFSSGLHGNTAADSVRSGWPLWHAAKSNAVSARRRIEWKLELKLSN